MTTKKRYAQVGIGGRSLLYSEAIVEQFADRCELAAICDNNPGRLRLRADWAHQRGVEIKTYTDTEFERMIAETRPDVVIVTSKDCTHDQYTCRAMELGCDVITEKPMTIDDYKCQRILDARKASGRRCQVTFNYRYSPPRTQLKELLMSGVIGDVVSVDFHWLLDTTHGADYFRRWHRFKANSGGLQVHKATHHFDLMNWWLSSVPETVYAIGARNFYTPATAQRYGLKDRGKRCLICPAAADCPFYLDLRTYADLVELYLDNESYDGYYRDQCVFGEDIDIQDTVHAIVTYRSGATMSYSLHAYMPWEGYIIAFNGSKGRLEHTCRETVYLSGDGGIPGQLVSKATHTRIIPHFQAGYEVEIWQGEGSHGGGDPVMLKDIFSANPPADKYKRAADERAGAWSILTGVCINRSMEWGRPVRVEELIHGLEEPDYPLMPSPGEPIDPHMLKRLNAKERFIE
jgi:predicted dehydrogenase